MKKLLSASLIVLTTFASYSCKDKDKNSDDKTTSEKVEGEWKMTEFKSDVESDDGMGGVFGKATSTGKNFTGTINFKSDQTFVSTLQCDVTIITSVVGFPTDTTTESFTDLVSIGNWSVNSSDDLVISPVVGTPITFDVVSATATTLKLHSEDEENDFGQIITTVIDITLNK